MLAFLAAHGPRSVPRASRPCSSMARMAMAQPRARRSPRCKHLIRSRSNGWASGIARRRADGKMRLTLLPRRHAFTPHRDPLTGLRWTLGRPVSYRKDAECWRISKSKLIPAARDYCGLRTIAEVSCAGRSAVVLTEGVIGAGCAGSASVPTG